MIYVLDASVAAKWVLPPHGEELVDKALEVQRKFSLQEIRFVVPDLFWPEFGNILWKAVRQGRMTRSSATDALFELREQKLKTIDSPMLIQAAFEIAVAFERTVYDAMYVALAVMLNAPLLTADQKLANSLALHFPVRWLGEL